jgi:nucleoside-diphosphate-sugar epimerase
VIFPAQLTEAMAICGIRRFINTGTSWKYFNSTEYRPVNLYAATKQAFEDVLAYYVDVHEWRAITLNLFDTYGSKDTRPKLINMLLTTARSQQELQLSPGKQLIDLVHINDVIAAYLKAESALSVMPIGHLQYGVSSESPVQLKELVATCEEAWGVRLPVSWGARPYRDREVMLPWNAYKKIPDWQPQVPLLNGLKQVFSESV